MPEKEPEKDFEVWKENWPALELFLKVQTQWRSSIGGLTGLCYADVISVGRLLKTPNLPEVFEDLQVLEMAVIRLMNKEGK